MDEAELALRFRAEAQAQAQSLTLALTLTPYSPFAHPRQVAKALSLSPPRVAVREVRGGAYVIFDLLPAATTAAAAAAGGAARADVAAA
eukprot:scaffold77837_cov47-Phaeocystis_antarctica.AAC.1